MYLASISQIHFEDVVLTLIYNQKVLFSYPVFICCLGCSDSWPGRWIQKLVHGRLQDSSWALSQECFNLYLVPFSSKYPPKLLQIVETLCITGNSSLGKLSNVHPLPLKVLLGWGGWISPETTNARPKSSATKERSCWHNSLKNF